METDVALQSRGNPTADTTLVSQLNPFVATIDSTMERRFQNDILRTDGIEQSLLHTSDIHTYQLLVQGDRKRSLATELSHLRPLMLLDRLFDGMNIILCQSLQLTHCILRQEASIGIYTQLNLLLGINIADALDEIEFLEEIDGTNLQFHTMETSLKLFLQSCQHLFVSTHPYQSIDSDTLFSSSERRVVEIYQVLHSCWNRDPFLLQHF